MGIEIQVKLTSEEYQRYYNEYKNDILGFTGMPPTFDQWVMRKLEEQQTQNEQRLLVE